jgi:hypothetical protein
MSIFNSLRDHFDEIVPDEVLNDEACSYRFLPDLKNLSGQARSASFDDLVGEIEDEDDDDEFDDEDDDEDYDEDDYDDDYDYDDDEEEDDEDET